MLSILLALTAPASAAEVQVVTRVPINILVDGVPLVWDENTGLGVVYDVPAGRHQIEARNLMGKTAAYKEVDLAWDDQIRFEYRKKELWHIGTYKLAAAVPPPVSTTTVVETHEQVVSPGIGVVVSDGHDSVSVGAGVLGAGVVVTDGHGSGVVVGVPVVGATTTTTTTVVTSGGEDHHAPVVDEHASVPVAPVGMDAGAFNALRSQIDKAPFSDDKLSVLRTAVANNWITCAQLGELLEVFDFASDKLEAVGVARNSVVDPQNAFLLNDKFSFSSDAQKAQAYFR